MPHANWGRIKGRTRGQTKGTGVCWRPPRRCWRVCLSAARGWLSGPNPHCTYSSCCCCCCIGHSLGRVYKTSSLHQCFTSRHALAASYGRMHHHDVAPVCLLGPHTSPCISKHPSRPCQTPNVAILPLLAALARAASLDFPVQGVPPQVGVVLLELQALRGVPAVL